MGLIWARIPEGGVGKCASPQPHPSGPCLPLLHRRSTLRDEINFPYSSQAGCERRQEDKVGLKDMSPFPPPLMPLLSKSGVDCH